jgi:hypothetical protein
MYKLAALRTPVEQESPVCGKLRARARECASKGSADRLQAVFCTRFDARCMRVVRA